VPSGKYWRLTPGSDVVFNFKLGTYKSIIARRLIIYVVLFSSLITLVTTAIQLAWDYKNDVALINNQLQQTQDVHLKSLTAKLWASDIKGLRTHLEGILQIRDMQFLETRDRERVWVSVGTRQEKNTISRQYPMVYRHRGRNITIGTLTVVASLSGIYRRLFDRVWIILVSNAIKTFLVATFILFIFHTLVTRHLARIADFARQLDVKKLGKRLSLEREASPAHKPDELAQVTNAINEMTKRLNEDITAIRRTEEKFQGLLESAPDAIVITNTEGRITLVNSQAEKLFGYPREELLGKSVETLIPARYRNTHPNNRTNFLAKPYARAIGTGPELYGLHKDGAEFPVEISLSPIEAEDGVLVISDIRDISERRRMEALTGRLGRILDRSSNEIYVFDAESLHFIQVNQGAQQNLGYTMEELKQLTPLDLKPEFSKNKFDRLIEPLRTAGKDQIVFETMHKRKDGTTYPVEVRLQLSRQEKPAVFVAVIQDISERRLAEQTLKKHAEELERSNAELERFAYVASHDLQEPLRMVASYVQLLQRRYQGKLDKDADEFIAFAVDGASQMKLLINDLLAYSRVGSSSKSFETVNTETTLEKALANLNAAINESDAEITHGLLPTVFADDSQLTLLFQNLISNAIKFHSNTPPRIQVAAEQDSRGWVFSIQDNGIGIDPEYAERIFVIFQRLHTRGDYPGTGIGLAICKKIVECHGGRIWVESVLGKGTKFYFTLPYKQEVDGYDEQQRQAH
jgi:PAS domain S-box-containing protein